MADRVGNWSKVAEYDAVQPILASLARRKDNGRESLQLQRYDITAASHIRESMALLVRSGVWDACRAVFIQWSHHIGGSPGQCIASSESALEDAAYCWECMGFEYLITTVWSMVNYKYTMFVLPVDFNAGSIKLAANCYGLVRASCLRVYALRRWPHADDSGIWFRVLRRKGGLHECVRLSDRSAYGGDQRWKGDQIIPFLPLQSGSVVIRWSGTWLHFFKCECWQQLITDEYGYIAIDAQQQIICQLIKQSLRLKGKGSMGCTWRISAMVSYTLFRACALFCIRLWRTPTPQQARGAHLLDVFGTDIPLFAGFAIIQ